jgi:hypothetical protein
VNFIQVGPSSAEIDAPEHNLFAARFLKKEFRQAFVEAFYGCSFKEITDGWNKEFRDVYLKEAKGYYDKDSHSAYYSKAKEKYPMVTELEKAMENPELFTSKVEFFTPRFEIKNHDVIFGLKYEYFFEKILIEYKSRYFIVELKPMLGDNFPSVLRKIRERKRHDDFSFRTGEVPDGEYVLLVDQFNSSVCTLEEVREMFGDQIRILTLNEILKRLLNPGGEQQKGEKRINAC